ncbi:glycoside hydrolase family 3 N-terminal domain-containing protein [Pseudonocardia acaciae]|uniref:glycoside hydrolase family 3 N-terminal domain-containing protein n=1 Tax=Pseudonocardia acaciae TaxID=551276 RepID=UPI00048A6614|nr:glycoside hydrolase family 3 N-terminal domain-containing protein [Pseudonocardia acaciae]
MTLAEDAHAVLLPVLDGLTLPAWAEDFLRAGGRALLLGETREEYVARRMSEHRRRTERAEAFTALARRAAETAGAPVLIAVDQEPDGIQRLHGLVAPLSEPAAEPVAAALATAADARALGVTMFLSPVLDVLTGENPWLAGRTMAADPAEVARLGAAFIQGTQAAGVLAVAKHFPGYRALPADPAVTDTELHGTLADLEPGLAPFRAAIDAGVAAVMLGPATVTALDAQQPASTSPPVTRLLRNGLGFTGLIVTDDLDAPATARGRSLTDTAVAALTAGADLLLLAGGPHLPELATAIDRAVADRRLNPDRLRTAAAQVRSHTPTP